MKRISTLALLFFLTPAGLLTAQQPPPIIYAESFRHDATRVTEESFEMKLTAANPTYRELIKDAHGSERFAFTVSPQILEGDKNIISWQATLVDLHHPMYQNVLQTLQEPSSDAQNNLWRFDPGQYAAVPTNAKRIIKVDSFYVTMQVKKYHFTPLDSPYLDSMTVQVDVKNTDPRPAPAP
jgi:hypothetical protein